MVVCMCVHEDFIQKGNKINVVALTRKDGGMRVLHSVAQLTCSGNNVLFCVRYHRQHSLGDELVFLLLRELVSDAYWSRSAVGKE